MKKEPLSIMIVKTLLAVVIFAGIGTIIISGGYLIGDYYKNGGNNKIVKQIPEKEFCTDNILEDCDGKKVNITGTLEYIPKGPIPILTNLENREAKYTWAGGVFLIWPKSKIPNMIEGATVNIIGKVSKGGQPCGSSEQPEQCLAPFHATQVEVESIEIIKQVKEVTITTDKTEYERGEAVKITVKNGSNNPIKHLQGMGCSLQGFSNKNKEWINASSKSCRWDGEDKLKPNSEYNFNWTASRLGLEKYRIAFRYQEQKIIETKEISKIICESKKLPDGLEELLLNGKWVKGDNKGCAMCDACFVCSCTMKNAWAVGEAVVDIHLVSCGGDSYTIKYKGEEYNCVSENYKQRILAPSENWKTIYSNEFTIKEKSALDPRCSEKVKDLSGVNDIDCAVILFGYEYDSVTEKCVTKAVDGCSFETPFNSLEECQEVCEKKENVVLPDEDELIKCGDDNDCALVNSGCCGCSMGGGVTCINKKYLGDWSQKLRLDCEGSIACPAVYLCDDNPTGCECVNNVCQGTGGGLTKL
ncbi:hypothetical protein KAT63_00330 [Candidatus Parcubacteria bacterium]|nr:hypothetical protein [Candidatus Parcubacteria bacterium]